LAGDNDPQSPPYQPPGSIFAAKNNNEKINKFIMSPKQKDNTELKDKATTDSCPKPQQNSLFGEKPAD
jgi:hypothetical protein